jgi:hypothetical protein
MGTEEGVELVLSPDEVQRFTDLGLGRGVDIANKSPWTNKSSFQVCEVTLDNIMGTDEGGLLQTYHTRLESHSDFHAQLKSSVSVPNTPVSFGLEGELSRSSISSKEVVGKKVTNRTISFKVDCKQHLRSTTIKCRCHSKKS